MGDGEGLDRRRLPADRLCLAATPGGLFAAGNLKIVVPGPPGRNGPAGSGRGDGQAVRKVVHTSNSNYGDVG